MPTCFLLYSIIVLSFIETFHSFYLLYVDKGLTFMSISSSLNIVMKLNDCLNLYYCMLYNYEVFTRPLEEYESHTTHHGIGVTLSPWLSFYMQVLTFYTYCIETFYNASQLCRLSSLSCILCKLRPVFKLEILVNCLQATMN